MNKQTAGQTRTDDQQEGREGEGGGEGRYICQFMLHHANTKAIRSYRGDEKYCVNVQHVRIVGKEERRRVSIKMHSE